MAPTCVFPPSEITVLYCLMSTVSKMVFHIFCPSFLSCFRWENKSGSFILPWPEQLLIKCSLTTTLRVIIGRQSSVTGGERSQSKISVPLIFTIRYFCSISPTQILGWPVEELGNFYHTDILVISSSILYSIYILNFAWTLFLLS